MLASLLARKSLSKSAHSTTVLKRGLWGNLTRKKKSKAKGAVQEEPVKSEPGEGLRSVATTNVFRAVNFELYAKPVSICHVCPCKVEIRTIVSPRTGT